MRHTSFLAIAAVSATAVHAASAQTRVRISEPTIARSYSIDREPEHRAALGIGTSTTGTLRDTLGLMITSITRGSPAEKAGLEEGNRLAAINGVSLKVNAADVEDGEMSSAFTRRLTRELAKSKPGDDVELKVYRDGRTQVIKVKTADSDILFPATSSFKRTTREELDNRAALGIGLGSTGSRRDSLGVLVMSVSDSSPASKAGIEEGNRIAAINGVNLRVAREDAGDRTLGSTKAQRLQREVSAHKPGDNVTLKVYSNGQFRDVTVKAVRAGDLPHSGASMFMYDGVGGDFPVMPAMPMMPETPMTPMTPMAPMSPMPAMPAMPAMPNGDRMELIAPMARLRMQEMPELRRSLDGARMQLQNLRPQIDRSLQALPRVRGYNVIV
jgi:S1-C subfamily serine protease